MSGVRRVMGASGRAIVPLVLAWALAGCSAVGGGSAVETYDLQAPKGTGSAARTRSQQVVVADPVVDRALDTDRIVVRPNPTSIA